VVKKDSLFYQNSEGGVTFGGGEPTAAGDFLLELLEASRAEGFHTCVDTCGFCREDIFLKVLELTDLFLFDLKHLNSEKHQQLTGQDNQLILKNLRQVLDSKVAVRIRMPLMPLLNDSKENIEEMAVLLGEFKRVEVEIMPYHAFGRNKYLAMDLPQPPIQPYNTQDLTAVIDRFVSFGLNPVVV
jgi:pyruvate formate lyase activating enzyme